MKRQAMILILTLIFAVVLCGAVSAADTSNATASDNLTVNANQSSNIENNNSQILPDPRVIRGGTVIYSTTTIQDAIDHAIDGDTIEVEAGTYNENVDVTKRLNITATGTATVTSFTITSAGSGSIIQGFTINNPSNAGITLNSGANNCQILRNVISGRLAAIYVYGNNNIISNNTMDGVANLAGWSETVFLGNTVGNTISKNIITSTATGTGDAHAIWLQTGANHNTVSENIITATCTPTGAAYGIEIYGPDNAISGNIITVISTSSAAYGIHITNGLSGNSIIGNSIEALYGVYSLSPDTHVNFNRIISNYAITSVNQGTLDAMYNWYGSNADPGSKISHYAGAIVNYNPWLVLTVGASPGTIYTGGTSQITADFTHDSAGGVHDPTLGHFPDGISIPFSTTLGTISNTLTSNGVAVAVLSAGSTPGVATVSGSLDSQSSLQAVVNIIQRPNDPVNQSTTQVNAASSTGKTVGMQETGVPVNYLILAILMVISGLISTKRN